MTHPSPNACAWLVQATVRGETLRRLESACAKNGNPLHRITVVPFSPDMPADMPPVGDSPFVFYGYTTLLLNTFRDPRWRRGVFFDPSVFRPSVYLKHWGAARMLNGEDACFLTMREFAALPATDVDPLTRWFVKPDDDLKRFTGGTMTHGAFRDWYANIERLSGEGDVGPDTPLLVAPPQEMGHEWRLFFVDGHIVARSCYTNDGRDLPLPPELEQFARQAAADWSPAPAFALDVTRDGDGRPCLIEANCLNGSGLYFADTLALVRAVGAYQEAVW